MCDQKISIEQQIKHLFDKHFDKILKYMNREKDPNYISDIDDGLLFEKISTGNSDMLLSFTINSDGAELFKPGGVSMWPIQLCANFLPPDIRFKSENILLYMLYVGKKKPNLTELFHPLAKEMNELQEKRIKFLHKDTVHTFVPIIMLGAFDLPARAMVSGIKQYSGGKACVYCLHTGTPVKDRRGHSYIRYVKTSVEVENRTHDGVVSAIETNSSNDKYGLIDIPSMFLFKNFDLTNGFVIDYMHNIVLGVTKLLIELWFGEHLTTKKNAPISPKNRNILDKRLTKLKPCSFVTRKPRPLKNRGNFKAIEYKYLLLFYLRFGLTGLIDIKYIKHFELLSSATFILLKAKITKSEVLQAGEMLIKFANDFETIFSSEAVTMNIHMLRHYGSSVLQCGPMWAYSMFCFEKNIGILKKSCHNPTNALDTIAFDYCLKRSEPKTVFNEEIVKMRNKVSLTTSEEDVLKSFLLDGHSDVFDTIETNQHIYKSKKSRPSKSIDYFIKMQDQSIGSLQFFVKNGERVFVVLESYKIVEIHNHLLRIKSTKKYEIFNCEQIYCKLMYMQFGMFEIVSQLPNFFETS